MRATTSLMLGTVFLAAALILLGSSTLVSSAVLAMIIFSAGEMLASPKFSEFLGNIAPPDKKAMWMGFSQVPILLGWALEGKLGPQFYHIFSAKDELARRMLVEEGIPRALTTEAALPVGKAFDRLVEVTGQSPEQLTQLLYQHHHVGLTWFIFAAVGLVAGVMIYFYGKWIARLVAKGG